MGIPWLSPSFLYYMNSIKCLLSFLIILNPKTEHTSTDQIAGELDTHDSMITSLAETLEEKGILTQEEWEARIKKKLS
jgi:predicted transcriptional regulator